MSFFVLMTLALMTPRQIERGEATAARASSAKTATPYRRWQHGPPADPAFLPIGVWLQDPRNAEAYKRAGINLYVALWQGPTEPQLATLKAAGMPVICGQTRIGLAHRDDPTIIGWMHGDEPDNAQEIRAEKTGRRRSGSPVAPAKLVPGTSACGLPTRRGR
jgi:hypothetical protein